MLKATAALILGPAIAFAPPAMAVLPLKPVPTESIPAEVGRDQQLWTLPSGQRGDYKTILRAIDHSLSYLNTPSAAKVYRRYPVPGVTQYRVIRSLKRFRELVRTAKTPTDLEAKVKQEFTFYQAIGQDGKGKVQFTSYYEPIYPASRVRKGEYRYPLYQKPSNLAAWPQPHPTRAQLEGEDGLQAAKGRLRGLELVWMRDRLDAYLVQIQGSARLKLPKDQVMSVGYAGKTDHPYTSIGQELVKDGKFKREELSLPVMIEYLKQHPQELNRYLPRNKRFIFFRETFGAPATGSINVPVSPERSIATDKSLMPPGALTLIHTKLPYIKSGKGIEFLPVSRYMLDQDAGSAIKGPGRVDVFMGTGDQAKARAGLVNHSGQLYYLLLKN
jgi:membrane-bound lytic murein transglycosylase A